MPVRIEPTVGRIVWYYENCRMPPRAAIIADVSSGRVTLGVFSWAGEPYPAKYVPVVQDGEDRPENGHFCEWMPYQKGQAAKTDKLEDKLEEWKRHLVTHHDEPLCDGPKAHDPFRGA